MGWNIPERTLRIQGGGAARLSPDLASLVKRKTVWLAWDTAAQELFLYFIDPEPYGIREQVKKRVWKTGHQRRPCLISIRDVFNKLGVDWQKANGKECNVEEIGWLTTEQAVWRIKVK
jgi:hypothetical protein